jgi:hypothetical protein
MLVRIYQAHATQRLTAWGPGDCGYPQVGPLPEGNRLIFLGRELAEFKLDSERARFVSCSSLEWELSKADSSGSDPEGAEDGLFAFRTSCSRAFFCLMFAADLFFCNVLASMSVLHT